MEPLRWATANTIRRPALHEKLYKHNNALFFPKYFGYLNNPSMTSIKWKRILKKKVPEA